MGIGPRRRMDQASFAMSFLVLAYFAVAAALELLARAGLASRTTQVWVVFHQPWVGFAGLALMALAAVVSSAARRALRQREAPHAAAAHDSKESTSA